MHFFLLAQDIKPLALDKIGSHGFLLGTDSYPLPKMANSFQLENFIGSNLF